MTARPPRTIHVQTRPQSVANQRLDDLVASVGSAVTGSPVEVAQLHDRIEHATRARPRTHDGSDHVRKLADQLHTMLADPRLRETRDERGRSTRSVCVEALLRLGFPYALEMHPAHLAWFRRESGTAEAALPTPALTAMSLISFVLYAGSSLISSAQTPDPSRWPELVFLAILMVGMVHGGVSLVRSLEPLKRAAGFFWSGIAGIGATLCVCGLSARWWYHGELPLTFVAGLTTLVTLPMVVTSLLSFHASRRVTTALSVGTDDDQAG